MTGRRRSSADWTAEPKALDRIPDSIARLAEAFWLHALEEGQVRARHALASQTRAVTDASGMR